MSHRAVRTILLLVAASCGDRVPSSEPRVIAPPTGRVPLGIGTAAFRGTVDMRSGALTFEPVSATSGTSGISRAIYGNQGVDVRIYTTPVTIDSTTSPCTKTCT